MLSNKEIHSDLSNPASQAVSGNPSHKQINVKVSLDFSYAVYFTHRVFDPKNLTMLHVVEGLLEHESGKMLFVVDQEILNHHKNLQDEIVQYCQNHRLPSPEKLIHLAGGEASKTQDYVDQLHQEMLNANLDRHSFVIAIGGGAMLDAVGYASTVFHRGMQLIRMPTTVLAQNDAGVGVKNGINAHGFKNLIGCFAPPFAVINDDYWLSSLSDRDYRSGFSEAVKVALIRDGEFYQWLRANADRLVSRDREAGQYLIKRCAELHLHQISLGGDPFEKGSARPLDYGHWCAHKLESLSKHAVSHGEAVAIGLVLDAIYAQKIGLLPQADLENIASLLKALGFSLYHPALVEVSSTGENLLLDGLEEFRQHLGGQLCITLLTGLGTAIEVHEIDSSVMLLAVQKLQELSSNH